MSHPEYAQYTDDELVRFCVAKGAADDRPFGELFRRHRSYIWRTCYRYFSQAEDAEDMAQEVFFKAYRALPRYEGRAAFRTWLHRIAINICLNELRSRRRRPVVSGLSMDEFSETIPGSELTDAYADRLLSQARLRSILSQIRREDQQALYLRDVEGYSFAEIAANLGISLSGAKMRVYRTRLALQKAYQELEQKEENHV